MDILESALDTIASIRTLLGLLALFAVLLILVVQGQRKSVLDRIGRSGLTGKQVLEILRIYQTDEERTKALKALLRHMEAITEASLDAAARNIERDAMLLRTYSHATRVLAITGTILLLLAILGSLQPVHGTAEGPIVEQRDSIVEQRDTLSTTLGDTTERTDPPRGPSAGPEAEEPPPERLASSQAQDPDTLVARARVLMGQRKFSAAYRLFDQARVAFSGTAHLDPQRIRRAQAAYSRDDFRTAALIYDSVFPMGSPR